jgi:spermidine/putrescine transport system permease protein
MGIFQTSARARAAALAAPPFAYALLLLAFPLIAIVLISFWTQDFLELDTTFTLANYGEIASEPIYRALLLRSLFVSAVVTMVTVILAYPVAYFVSFHVAPEKKALWLFLITIPFWTSYLIRVFLSSSCR